MWNLFSPVPCRRQWLMFSPFIGHEVILEHRCLPVTSIPHYPPSPPTAPSLYYHPPVMYTAPAQHHCNNKHRLISAWWMKSFNETGLSRCWQAACFLFVLSRGDPSPSRLLSSTASPINAPHQPPSRSPQWPIPISPPLLWLSLTPTAARFAPCSGDFGWASVLC